MSVQFRKDADILKNTQMFLMKIAINYDIDTNTINWKTANTKVFKSIFAYHFKFNLSKHIYVKRKSRSILICGE